MSLAYPHQKFHHILWLDSVDKASGLFVTHDSPRPISLGPQEKRTEFCPVTPVSVVHLVHPSRSFSSGRRMVTVDFRVGGPGPERCHVSRDSHPFVDPTCR